VNWLIPVVGRVITAHVMFPAVVKKIAGLPDKVTRIYWQFIFCLVLSLGVLVVSVKSGLDSSFLLITSIGIANSLAVYAQWKAIDLNLSKTALLTQADDIIAVVLGQVLLSEGEFLNWLMIVGLILVFLGASASGSYTTNLTLLKWVGLYSVIWGVAVVIFRHLAIEDMPIGQFMTGWYLGSLLGAYLLIKSRKFGSSRGFLGTRETLVILALAILVWASMLLNYIALQNAPIVVVQPLFQLSEMIFPLLVGLIVFKEAKRLSALGKVGMVVSLTGGILIIAGYSL